MDFKRATRIHQLVGIGKNRCVMWYQGFCREYFKCSTFPSRMLDRVNMSDCSFGYEYGKRLSRAVAVGLNKFLASFTSCTN